MNKKEIYYDAYFTVEASYIMPVAIMILLLTIYWGFFCYDKSVSIQCSYLAALRTSNEWKLTIAESERMALEILEDLTDKTILYTRKGELYVDVGVTRIEAGVNGKLNTLFSGLGGINTIQWKLDSKKSAYRLKPSSYIRKYRLLGNAINGVKLE